MSMILEGIDLSELWIEDELQVNNIDSRTAQTLGGLPVVWEQEQFGEPVTIAGGDQFGWLTRTTVQALLAMARVPNQEYTLTVDGESKTVRFRHEERPVIEAEPVLIYSDPQDTDYYNKIKIKLAEVNA